MGKFTLTVLPDSTEKSDTLLIQSGDNDRSGLKILTYMLYYAYYNTFEDSLNKYYLQQIMDTSSEKSSPSFQTVLEKMLLYMNDIEKYQGVNQDENSELLYDNKIVDEVVEELVKLIGAGHIGDLFYELQASKLIKANKNAKTEITTMYKNFSKDDSYDLKYYSDLTKYTKNMLDENNKYVILMSNVIYNLYNIHYEKIFYSLNYDINNDKPRIYGNITTDRPTLFKIEGIKGRAITVVDLAKREAARDAAKAVAAEAAKAVAAAKAAKAAATEAAKAAKPAPGSAKSAVPGSIKPETLVQKKELKNPHAKIKVIKGPNDKFYEDLLAGKESGLIKTQIIGGGTINQTTGITNTGNTCWFNTFLQLLWDISDFRNFVINTMDYQFINELKFIHHQNLNIDFDMTDRELAYFKGDERLDFTEKDDKDGIDGFADFLRALHVLFKAMDFAIKDEKNNYTINIKDLMVPGINRPIVSCYMYILNKAVFNDLFTKEERKTHPPPDPITGYSIQLDALVAFQWFLKYFTNVINRPILDLLKKFYLVQRNIVECKNDPNISFGTPILQNNLDTGYNEDMEKDSNLKDLQYIIDSMTIPETIYNSNVCSDFVTNLPSNVNGNINATKTTQVIPFKDSKYIYISLIRVTVTEKEDQSDAKKSEKYIKPNPTLRINNIDYKLKGVIDHSGDANSGHYTYYSYVNDNIAYWASDRTIKVNPDKAINEALIGKQACGFLYEIIDKQSLDHSNSLKRIPFKLYEHNAEKGLLDAYDNNSVNIAEIFNVDKEYLKLFVNAGIRSVGFKNTPTKLDKSVFGQVIQESMITGDEKFRIDVAIDTIDILEQDSESGYLHFQAYHNLSVWENIITKAGKKNTELADKYFTTLNKGLRILQGDWGDVTLLLTKEFGKIFSCLNMANSVYPGSSYLKGKSAQEENMFRRTDCHYSINERHIKKQTDYDTAKEKYDPNTRRYNLKMFNLIEGQPSTDPIDNYERFVYMDIDYPRICIKGKEEFNTKDKKIDKEKSYKLLKHNEIFPFYELRAAAKNYNDHSKTKWRRYSGNCPEELKDIIELRLRIRAQINTLKNAEQKYAVLSAFGAGAFNNDCSNVAMIYYDELLAEREFFKVIAFAIYFAGNGENNFEIFQKVFETWPEPKQIEIIKRVNVNEIEKPPTELLKSKEHGRPNTDRPNLEKDEKQRRLIMENTLEVLDLRRIEFYTHAKHNLETFKAESTTEINHGECLVTFVEEDSLSATKTATTTYGIIFACLNFADSKKPGGGYRNGRSPQEEDIFLRTDCHFSLGPRNQSDILFGPGKDGDYIYDEKKTALIQGITGRVYLIDTPQICFRSNSDTNYSIYPNKEIFPFYELRAAALNFNPKINPYVTFPNTSIEAIAQTELRIAAQLDTLIERGLRCVVLGAFGCGAFQNNPNIVANAYHKEITKRKTHFDVIVFAMAAKSKTEDNYLAFKLVFKDWKK